ncbi:MAG: RNA polymerase sigma factor [Saprospiraceae bacterium]|nr:RNA polymerase sigma factor [Saprospiraceae bacterium]
MLWCKSSHRGSCLYAYGYSSDRESARDALQDCFLNAFKYINTFSGKGSFDGWLKRIAVTAAITHQKSIKRYIFEEIIEEANWHMPIFLMYSKIGKDEILKLLKKLSESLILVFNLYVIEGYH